MKRTRSKNHPAIRFTDIPVVYGPLKDWESHRAQIISDVISRAKEDLSHQNLEVLLSEALWGEKRRLKKDSGNFFTRRRFQEDRRIWNLIQGQLVRPPAEADRKQVLDLVLRNYGEEIAGHFSPSVYRFATRAVPWCFSWLLNAASVQRILPWGMTESLKSRLQIVGEISSLQSLAQRGTILLVPTHQSNIDSVLIGYVIYLMSLPPFAYGAGLNLFSNPALSFFMSRLGAYTVDRKKNNFVYKTVLKEYSTKILKEGIHSIFFPGGGRSRSGAIETKVKLGLLGTGLDAEIDGILAGSPKPRIYVVPMVTSYHFVLEAKSLIEDALEESGRHRYIMMDDESWQTRKILEFFWKLFSSESKITVRIGKPLDVFGNFVDDEGRSIGPNGTFIDPIRWLTTRGQVLKVPERDKEYTRNLGTRLVERFHKENTVLTSHAVAFVFFEALRQRYPDFDLFRFLRLSEAQRTLPFHAFLAEAEIQCRRFKQWAEEGQFYLSSAFLNLSTEEWVRDGVKNLGIFHEVAVLKIEKDMIYTEDMNLLYYYRNRLSGYGLSTLAGDRGSNDSKGFLA